jgi:hypothetical protein
VNDKPSWKKFETLFYGPVPVSIINEPIEPVAPIEVARQRWRSAEVISREGPHER